MFAGADHLTGKLPPRSRLHNDQYLIVDTVGKGGMGAVYEAVDIQAQPKRRVAIKEMSQLHLKSSQELANARKRFRGEANMLRSLDHPNLPRVYDSFEERGRSYLVMQFIEGKTLAQLLQARGGRPLPFEDVLNYACQLCDVLDLLHRQYPPIVFRDLKPANVMVTAQGHLYLIDFGVARFFKDNQSQQQETEYFLTKGYAPPEQYKGITSPRSDLYSLGVTLYVCLTARDPLSNVPTLFDFPSVCQYAPLVPKSFERLIQRLVDFKEQHRPRSAEDVRQELVKIIQQSQNLAVRFQQVSPFSLEPALPVTQSRLILPGDRAAYNDKTFSANQPLPAPVGSRPAWIANLVGASQFFLRWCTITFLPTLLALFASIFLGTRNAISPRIQGGQKISLANVGRDLRRAGEDFALAVRTWSSRVLTPRFVLLLLARLALLLAGCIFVFRTFHGSYTMVAFCLALILLLITATGSSSSRIRDAMARNLLFCMALVILLVCIALQAAPDMQSALHAMTISQLLSIVLVTSAVCTLVRTSNRFTGIDNATMIIITVTCALLQFTFGPQELSRLPGQSLTSDTAAALTQGLTTLLALIAFIFLCRIGRPFNGFDRFLLLLVALVFTGFQLTRGYIELQHLPFLTTGIATGRSSSVAYVDILLIIVPLLAASIALFAGQRFEYMYRLAIFLLALACALLQSVSAADVAIFPPAAAPVYPLMDTVIGTFTLNQILLFGGLLVAGILLLLRLVLKAGWIDRPAVFITGFVCALLLWSLAPNMLFVSLFGYASSGVNQDLLLALHQIVSGVLLLCVFSALGLSLCVAIGVLAQQLGWIQTRTGVIANNSTWVKRIMLVLDRTIIFGSTLSAALLVLFLGAGQGQNSAGLYSQTVSIQSAETSVNQLIALLLGFLALIALFRFLRPVNRWDCLTLLLVVGACGVLVRENSLVQHIAPPVIANMQQFMGNLLQGKFPNLLLFCGFVALSVLSLLWLRRSLPRDQMLYFFLFFLFSSALICFALHYLWPVMLVVALLALIQGVFIVIQMERVR